METLLCANSSKCSIHSLVQINNLNKGRAVKKLNLQIFDPQNSNHTSLSVQGPQKEKQWQIPSLRVYGEEALVNYRQQTLQKDPRFYH